MHGKIFFLAISGFALGTVIRSLSLFGWPIAGFILLIGLIFLFGYGIARQPLYLHTSLCFIALALGMGRVMLVPNALPPAFASAIGTSVSLEGIIAVDPDVRDTNQRITVDVAQGGARTRILAIAPLYPAVSFGETVRISGVLKKPEPFATDGGRTFRYDRYLEKDGIFALMQNASVDVLAPRQGPMMAMLGSLIDFKNGFAHAIEAVIPPPESGLASGIIVGGKQGLGPTLLEAFTVAGMLQIVVLSGYNVMIVAEGIRRALGFLPKQAALGAAAVGIALFVFAAGAGSSAVRAGLMALVALFALATGRTYDALRALFLVLLLMLLWNPLLLAYDVGLQLSLIATLGLIIGTSIVERRLMFIQSAFLRDIIATTIAAQIAVLPLLLYQTGNLSLVSFPANVLAMPVIPWAMATSALAAAIGFIAPPLTPYVGFPAYVLLAYVIHIAEISAALPLARIIVPAFPFWSTLLAYAVLGWIVRLLYKKTPAPAKTSPGASMSPDLKRTM